VVQVVELVAREQAAAPELAWVELSLLNQITGMS
jgi:hypothetical protein